MLLYHISCAQEVRNINLFQGNEAEKSLKFHNILLTINMAFSQLAHVLGMTDCIQISSRQLLGCVLQ